MLSVNSVALIQQAGQSSVPMWESRMVPNAKDILSPPWSCHFRSSSLASQDRPPSRGGPRAHVRSWSRHTPPVYLPAGPGSQSRAPAPRFSVPFQAGRLGSLSK